MLLPSTSISLKFLHSSKSWLLLHNGQCGGFFLSFLSSAGALSSDTVKKFLTLFLLAGLSFTVLSSESVFRENNGSLIKSSRSGSLLLCLLIFDASLFYLSVRPPGSFEAIIHNILVGFKVFHLWLTATLLHFSKKLRNFLNPLESPNLICCQSFTSFL